MSASTKTNTVKSTPAQKPSVKDSGKVRIGGVAIHFGVKDSGKVRVGGVAMRF